MKLSRTSSSGPSSCCTSATQSAQTPFDSHFSKASDSFRLSPPDESSFIPVADRSASLAHPSSPSQTGLSATPSTSAASAEQRWKRPEVWFWSERHVALLQREGRGEGGAAADSSAVQQEGDAFGCGSWLRSSVDCMRSFNVFRLLPPQSQSLHKLFLHKAVTGLSRTLAFLQKAQRSALLSLPTNGAAAKLDLMQTFVARLSGGLLKAERHSVYTADGFLLCLYSLRRARRTCCLAAGCRCLEVDGLEGGEGFTAKEDLLDATRTPVFYFQHGLLESSLNWVSGGWRSLPFMLAAAGAEVWVGNNRGNEFARPCVQRGKGAAGFDLASLERFVQSRLLLLTEKSPAESETETEREQGSGGSGVLGRSRQSLEGEGLCSNFCCRCSRLTSFPDVRGASLERQLAVLRGACWEALSLLLRLRGVPCFSSFPNQGRGSSSAGLEGDSRCTGEAPLTDETSLPPFREHLQQTCAGHWSFHEMAVLDLPAQLQFVAENSPSLNANGKSRVGSCVGHSSSARPSSVFGSGVVCVGQSQGAAQILACLSLAPSLSGLIRQAVVFSPPLILQPLRRLPRGAVLLLRVGLKSPVFLLRLLRGVALALPSFALGSLGDAVAGHGHGLGMRFYTTPLQREQREINFRHTPSGGTSLRNFAHWLYLLNEGRPLSALPPLEEEEDDSSSLSQEDSGLIQRLAAYLRGEAFPSPSAKRSGRERGVSSSQKKEPSAASPAAVSRRQTLSAPCERRYPIEDIQSVVHAFLGGEDNLVDAAAAAEYLRASLEERRLFLEQVEGVGHLDFGWGRDRVRDLYPRLIHRVLQVAASEASFSL